MPFFLKFNILEELSVFVMSGIYIFAGIMHFIVPRQFEKIIPPYIPAHRRMVYLSGLFEILFGIGLLIEDTRSLSAIGIMLLLIAVFPANLYMAKLFKRRNHKYTWLAYARLPLQLLLIYWAFLFI
jgi:uncharacterized membrane protein